jgi:hypothetical protein
MSKLATQIAGDTLLYTINHFNIGEFRLEASDNTMAISLICEKMKWYQFFRRCNIRNCYSVVKAMVPSTIWFGYYFEEEKSRQRVS